MLDGQTVIKTPVTVEVAPRKLRVVVGKDRLF
jgi:diacylglycerol kinase family enzyme